MTIGKLDQRITFQEETRVVDGGGGHSTVWADMAECATVWAAVEPMTGREGMNAQQVEETVKYKITIRRRSDLAAKMQIIWKSNANKALNVRAIQDAGARSMYTEILADEGRAA